MAVPPHFDEFPAPEPRSFSDFYADAYPRVLAVARLWCSRLDEADDATDEAFARAAASWSRVQGMQSPTGWTIRVAINRARREGSRARRRVEDRGGSC